MDKLLFLLPYWISLAITASIFLYAYRYRHAQGMKAYLGYVAGQLLWGVGYIFELISPTLRGKLFWDSFQWIPVFMIAIAFLVFAIQFTQIKIKWQKFGLGLLLVISFVFLGILLTDPYHHLIYTDPYLDQSVIFSDLKYKFTGTVYVIGLYSYLASLVGLGFLLSRLFRPNNLYRRQILVIALGFFIPVGVSVLTLVGVELKPFRDISPITFAIGNLVIAWGLFHYKLFDVVPIARDLVLENLEDLVFVLDIQDRIVDLNAKAIAALNVETSRIIGQPATMVFGKVPEVLESFSKRENLSAKITLPISGKIHHFEVKSTLLTEKNGRFIGRAFIASDVTEYVELQEKLEILNEELEDRVARRTRELQESGARYRALFEQNHNAIFVLDLQGHHLDVNQRAADLLGYSRPELLGLSFRQISGEEAQSEQMLARLLQGEHIPLFERLFRKKNGELISVEINVELVRDLEGFPLHVQSVVRDLSERKQTEELLRISEQRYRRLSENAPDIIFRYALSPEPKLEYINPAVERITGYTPAECYADPFLMLNMAHPDDAHLMAELMQSLGPLSKPIIMRWVGKDGVIRWMESRLTPVYDQSEQLIAVEGLTRNITERKQAEENLKESEEIYRKAIEIAGGVPYRQTYSQNAGFKIYYDFIGEGIQQLTGYNPDEFTMEVWDTLVLESHLLGELSQYSWAEAAQRVRAGSSPFWLCEHRIQTLNGGFRWVYEAAVELRDKDGISCGSIGLFQDITERKRAEVQLNEQLDELRRWHQATLGREERILDLKREVNELLQQVDKPPRYPSAEDE
ncbi:MAG TPA: hypothetical protein DEH22_15955 [Chloroflexi bacterium]|nr:hypothetical protein [Chloroflexota bacterium]